MSGAVDVDSADGCTVCEKGFFVSDRMCGRCNETDVGCFACDGTKCLSCADDFVLVGGLCVPHTSVAH